MGNGRRHQSNRDFTASWLAAWRCGPDCPGIAAFGPQMTPEPPIRTARSGVFAAANDEIFFTRADLTPLSATPCKAPDDCFNPENSNFGLWIQIFDSKGIHLFHRRYRYTPSGPCRDVFLNPKSETFTGVIMKNKLLAALLVVASASIAAPAFASGYGPAPFYSPSVGAPASQQGQSVQTVAAERAAEDNNAYGGVKNNASQSGARQSASQSVSGN
jgi:hypothetical protein